LNIVEATHEDAGRIAGLFRAEYGQSSHPCQEPEYIRAGIASGNEIWRVAEVDSQLAGCMCVVKHCWNRSSELGRAIILPRYRSFPLCYRLTRACLSELNSGDSTLSFCVVRSHKAYRLANRISGFPWVTVGHDGGRNVANGSHEYHIYAVARPKERQFAHIAPIRGAAAQSSFVHDVIYAPLGLTPLRGTYPNTLFAGASDGVSDFPFRYSFEPMANAVELSSECGGRKTEADVARSMEQFIQGHWGAVHISAQVLADKAELIRTMLDRGFEITAYLPAWHCHEGARYDCLMLVKRQWQGTLAANGFESEIGHLTAGLGTLAAAFQGSRDAALVRAA
jgi:hypothetical protein